MDATKPYDMVDIIEWIADDSQFDQFKEDYGKTIVAAMHELMAGQWVLLPINE